MNMQLQKEMISIQKQQAVKKVSNSPEMLLQWVPHYPNTLVPKVRQTCSDK